MAISYSESWSRLLATLDFVEKLGDSDIPSCAGCLSYWEDPRVEPRAWGYCRRWAPATTGENVQPYDAQSIDYNWYCGEFHPGPHKTVIVQRLKWRQELEQARDSAKVA